MRFLITSTLLFVVPFSAHAIAFTQNLYEGLRHHEVRLLQIELNKDKDTQLAVSGPGSPGNETDFFGPITKNAVVRFQEKYQSEVLVPVDLAAGNGFVGLYTRQKLNGLFVEAPVRGVPEMTSPSTVGGVPDAESDLVETKSTNNFLVTDAERIDLYQADRIRNTVKDDLYKRINDAVKDARENQKTDVVVDVPEFTSASIPSAVIQRLSPTAAKPGDYVYITGSGFAPNSRVHIGTEYVVRETIPGLSGISFVVPDMPTGRYDLAVFSAGAITNTMPFVVKSDESPTVFISTINPNPVRYGKELVVVGQGFSDRNTVITGLERIDDVASDGSTIRFVYAPEQLKESANGSDGTYELPLSLHVISEHGVSQNYNFILKM